MVPAVQLFGDLNLVEHAAIFGNLLQYQAFSVNVHHGEGMNLGRKLRRKFLPTLRLGLLLGVVEGLSAGSADDINDSIRMRLVYAIKSSIERKSANDRIAQDI